MQCFENSGNCVFRDCMLKNRFFSIKAGKRRSKKILKRLRSRNSQNLYRGFLRLSSELWTEESHCQNIQYNLYQYASLLSVNLSISNNFLLCPFLVYRSLNPFFHTHYLDQIVFILRSYRSMGPRSSCLVWFILFWPFLHFPRVSFVW